MEIKEDKRKRELAYLAENLTLNKAPFKQKYAKLLGNPNILKPVPLLC